MPDTPNPHGRIRIRGAVLLQHLGGDAWEGTLLPTPPAPEEVPAGARVYAADVTLAEWLDAGAGLREVARG